MTTEIIDGLYLIDLPQPAEGFEKFISAWYFRDNMERNILVETGPASTAPMLIDELSKLAGSPDYILLTHIHLDHAGGLGHLMSKFGSAKVFVSDSGRKHLVAPEKLWNASISTLGDFAKNYGEPLPVSPGVFLNEDEGIDGIEIFKTPGHAPHHITFRIPFKSEHLLFAGEAVGVTLPGTERLYLRPTTPPKFDAQAALASLDLLSKISSDDDILCYAHFGSDVNARRIIINAKEQLILWIQNISMWQKDGMENERMTELLLSIDPLLADFKNLPKRFQSRELSFIDNSLQGIINWIINFPSTRI